MPVYLPFDPTPRTPVVKSPHLMCDSQFHVLGPRERYPVRLGAIYEMPSATIAAALKMQRALRIERGIIVQPTTYGADHSVTLDGLAEAGPHYKGCANAIIFNEARRRLYRQAPRSRRAWRALHACRPRHKADG